jgi:hypothetical protein
VCVDSWLSPFPKGFDVSRLAIDGPGGKGVHWRLAGAGFWWKAVPEPLETVDELPVT